MELTHLSYLLYLLTTLPSTCSTALTGLVIWLGMARHGTAWHCTVCFDTRGAVLGTAFASATPTHLGTTR